MTSELPPTVAAAWRPREEEWHARGPSPFVASPNRPLFIGACPRSGTTLLRFMLDIHPDLAIPHETNFIRPLWWQRAQFGDLRERSNRRAVGRFIFRDPARGGARLRQGRITRKQAIRRVVRSPPTIGSIVETCLRIYAQGHGKPRWGDKRPAYSGFVGMLLAMFPNAQYVNVVRDPRGAVASQMAMGWDRPEIALPAAVARWEGAILRTDHFARDLRPDQLIDVRYEDLVADPHATLARICAFAGLRAEDETIAAMASARRDHAFQGRFARLAEPVSTASVERWRERLTPEQAVLVERSIAPLLDRFGYRAAEDLGGVEPSRDEEREVARQRRASRLEWQRSRIGELRRRVTYRQPVAAMPRRRRPRAPGPSAGRAP